MGTRVQAVPAAGNTFPRGIARLVGFAIALAIIAFGIVNLRIESNYMDFWQHLAAIRFLATDLLSPPTLYLRDIYEVHLYTPYHVVWAAAMAAGHLDIWSVAAAAGISNLVLFIYGCRLLARHVIGDERMDFALFVTLLVFWGAPAWWSGVYSLGQIVLQAAYPSFFALSAAMVLGALYLEEGRQSLAWQTGFAVVIAAVFVTHPITTSFLLIFLAIKTLMRPEPGLRLRAVAWAAWPPLAGLALALFWPYFSVPGLILATGSLPDAFGGFFVFYTNPLGQIGPAVLGLAALPLLRQSNSVRFLVALLAAFTFLYGINYVLHISQILSRFLIFIAFTLQLLWVAWFAHHVRSTRRSWAIGAFAAIATLAASVQVMIGAPHTYGPVRDLVAGAPQGSHAAAQEYHDLESLGPPMASSSTVMAPPSWAYPLVALTGARVVALPYDAPTLPDGHGRRADAAQFFDPEATCELRVEILRRHGADYVLALANDPSAGAIAKCFWPTVTAKGRFVLYAVKQETES